MKTITTKNAIDLLLQPIIPIGIFGYFMCNKICNISNNTILFLILFVVFLFVSYKVILFLKINSDTFYHITIGCVDWFLLDIVNLFSNNTYSALNPSILETLSKLSLQVVLQ